VSGLKKESEPEAQSPRAAAGTTPGGSVAPQNQFFRVSGTNLTLKQLVVFHGNFLANTGEMNAVVVGKKPAAEPALPPLQNTPAQGGLVISNALIQGQATIGSSNRIEINAAPVQ